MKMAVVAGALASSHITSAPPRMFLVLQPLGFAPLWQLALPPGSYCIFHNPGLCRGCTFRTVPGGLALGALGVGLALG